MKRDSSPDDRIRQRAEEQSGAFSASQALEDGLTRSGLWRRAKSGVFIPDLPGTFVLPGTSDSWRRRLNTALLHVGNGAVVGGRSAAAVYGLDGILAREIEIVVDRSYLGRRRIDKGIILHRTNYLPDEDVVHYRGFPLTTPARTLLDLAAVLDAARVRRAMISAIDRRLVTPEQIHDLLQRCGKPGRPGTASLRQVMESQDWDRPLTDSDLEDIAFEAIIEYGLPEPIRHFDIWDGTFRIGEFDLVYPTPTTAIEAHGHEFHSSKPDFCRDCRRVNNLMAASWAVLFFTVDDSRRPRHFLHSLERTLEARQR